MCITNTWILLIHMFYEISIIRFISFVNFGYLLIFCWKIRSYYKFPYHCENIWCLVISFVLWITLIVFSCIYFRNHPTDSNKDGAYLFATDFFWNRLISLSCTLFAIFRYSQRLYINLPYLTPFPMPALSQQFLSLPPPYPCPP